MAEQTAPTTYLGLPVPDEIRALWWRWEGADWRTQRHIGTNNIHPPDMRFSVRRPDGMCPLHSRSWIEWRDHRFDPVTGDRWPGGPGSPFIVIGSDLNRVREERRVEWDRKTAEQMQLIESICLSGRSPQCDRVEVASGV